MDWSGSLTSITVGRWATSVDTKPTHQLVWWKNRGDLTAIIVCP